ncbi:MAG: hypothetical protein AB3N23_09035 [Paracoccaceae bacterium]
MRYVSVLSFVLLAGCSQVSGLTDRLLKPGAPAEEVAGEPLAAPLEVEPVEDVDTGETPVPVATGGGSATTIASLGDPARQGAWMETPLVTAEQAGQVHYKDKGINVTLIPSGGPAGGGSRLSVEAMQALGLPLTELTEVKVLF